MAFVPSAGVERRSPGPVGLVALGALRADQARLDDGARLVREGIGRGGGCVPAHAGDLPRDLRERHYFLGSVAAARHNDLLAERRFREALAIFGRPLLATHLNVGIAQMKHERALLRQRRSPEVLSNHAPGTTSS
jgi:hypothetical protein